MTLTAAVPGNPAAQVQWDFGLFDGQVSATNPNVAVVASNSGLATVGSVVATNTSDPNLFGKANLNVTPESHGFPPTPVQIFGPDIPVEARGAVAAGGDRYYEGYGDPNSPPGVGDPQNLFVKQFDLNPDDPEPLHTESGVFSDYDLDDPSTIPPNVAADCQGNGYWLEKPPGNSTLTMSRFDREGGVETVVVGTFFDAGPMAVACDGRIYFLGEPAAPGTARISIDSSGSQGNGISNDPSISADGRYVAFWSSATNLVGGDTNGRQDIFVRDRQGGVTSRVSVDSSGAQGNGDSLDPSISADGRYVAFTSAATNLVTGDTNARDDIFVHDRQTGVTNRVSVNSAGAQGNDHSQQPSISADGRYVAFQSIANNLAGGDQNGTMDIFVRDLQSQVVNLVSVDFKGFAGNGGSALPSISADGRYVAFRSFANNLVGVDANEALDVFVRDRQLGQTSLVSVDSAGAQGNGLSPSCSISADGRFVAFSSAASNLVAGDTNGFGDAFVHDRQSGATSRVSIDSGGLQGNSDSLSIASISADGRYVAFESTASNLVAADTNGSGDAFVRDRLTGTTERVSVDSDGAQGNSNSYLPSISADGRYVAFGSIASNLVASDTNAASDVFLRDRGPAQDGDFGPVKGRQIFVMSSFGQPFELFNIPDYPDPGIFNSIAVDAQGRVVLGIDDQKATTTIVRVNPDGTVDDSFQATPAPTGVVGVAVDGQGVVYAATTTEIQAFNAFGNFVYRIDHYVYHCRVGCTTADCETLVPFQSIQSIAAGPGGQLRITDDVVMGDSAPEACKVTVRLILIDP